MPNWSSEEAHLLGEHHPLNQQYGRCISADRLNREDSQLAAYLEGEPGPTPPEISSHTHTPKAHVSEEEGTRFLDNIICDIESMSG